MRSNASSILVVVFLEKAVVWQGAMLSCHRYSLFLKCISQSPLLLCDALGPLERNVNAAFTPKSRRMGISIRNLNNHGARFVSVSVSVFLPTSFAPQVKHIMNYLFHSHQLGNERHKALITFEHLKVMEENLDIRREMLSAR